MPRCTPNGPRWDACDSATSLRGRRPLAVIAASRTWLSNFPVSPQGSRPASKQVSGPPTRRSTTTIPGTPSLGSNAPTRSGPGAEDGSEMGVWSFLRNPQRETNLRIRLDEYLPFGLEPALIYVT